MRKIVGVGVLAVFLWAPGCDESGDGGGGPGYVAGPGINIDESTGEISADVGANAGQVAAGDHDHDDRYVNVTGDTMTGDLTMEGNLTFAVPKQRCYSIPACVFIPAGNKAYGVSRFSIWQTVADGPSFFAPVHLPSGATITDFLAFVEDSDAAANITVRLWCIDLTTPDTASLLAILVSSDSPGNTTLTATGIGHLVDNANYGYVVRASWNSLAVPGLRLRNARIYYTITQPLP